MIHIIYIMNDTNLYEKLQKMIEKYSNNEYVFGRLVNYMENLLPSALENAAELQKQREERRTQLSANRDEFTTRFLEKNRYFYSAQTDSGDKLKSIYKTWEVYRVSQKLSPIKSLYYLIHYILNGLIKHSRF